MIKDRIIEVAQGSSEWHALRADKVTGTKLGNIYSDFNIKVTEIKDKLKEYGIGFTTKMLKEELYGLLPPEERDAIENRIPMKKEAWELVAAGMLDPDVVEGYKDISPANRGLVLETAVLADYANKYKVEVTAGAVVKHPHWENVIVSTDGLVIDDNQVLGLEVKCLNSGLHLKTLMERLIPDEYIPQICMYFICMPECGEVKMLFYDDRFKDPQYHTYEHTITREMFGEHIAKYENFLERFNNQLNALKESL